MTLTTRTPLGADTFVHKWCVDVNDTANGGTFAVPVWKPILGTNDFVFTIDPSTEDDGDFDSVGWGSEVVSSRKWKAETTLLRKTKEATPTAYDDGQEICRLAGFELGASNRLDVRVYEYAVGGPKTEAYRGYASVQWVPAGGDNKAIDKVKLTLNGSGALTKITHPDGAQVAPVVTSITPNTGSTSGGTLVIIKGSHFMLAGVDDVVATTGIMLAAHNFTSWTVLDDNTIAATTPAETAITSPITVTNSAGASNTTVTFTCS
ncbi:MAG: IPT/TIG domain-containing protein [Phycisphaerales bacterium]